MRQTFIILTLTLLLSSCHTSEYHYKKFIEKGGRVENIIDSVEVIKTIDGKDSLVFIKLGCPEVKFPKSKTEIRQEERTNRRGIKADEKIALRNLQLEINKIKEENKTLRTRLRKEPKINKQNNITKRTEIRQNNKTERKKHNYFWIITYVLGVLTPTFFKLIKKLI